MMAAMNKHLTVLIYAAVAVPVGALVLRSAEAAFFGGGSLADWLVPVLIGLGLGVLGYVRAIPSPREPNA